jgi:hypothetical protein
MIFKTLSKAEYDRLNFEQRADYLKRLMEDIQRKAAENRAQMERNKGLMRPEKK